MRAERMPSNARGLPAPEAAPATGHAADIRELDRKIHHAAVAGGRIRGRREEQAGEDKRRASARSADAQRLVAGASLLVAVTHADADSAVVGGTGHHRRGLPCRRLWDRRVGRTLRTWR